jgi:hypothetical protein
VEFADFETGRETVGDDFLVLWICRWIGQTWFLFFGGLGDQAS